MSNLERKMRLQLFADGGAGGAAAASGADAGGDAAATGVNGTSSPDADVEVPASIPEKAKEIYRKAMKRQTAAGNVQPTPPNVAEAAEEAGKPADEAAKEAPPEGAPSKAHVPYSELIKSPEYKDEHKQYMNDAFQKRFKNQAARNAQKDEILSTVATKYGLDPQSESFFDDLKKAVEEDDAYFEAYAAEHDMTSGEARRVALLEQKLAAANREAEERRTAEENAERIRTLRENAVRTKEKYPGFDLDTEMRNPKFGKMLALLEGDTTGAYKAVHHDEIVTSAVQRATQDAARATVNNIRGGSARPSENGASATAQPAVAEVDYSKMNLKEIRAQADYWRRNGG